MSLIEENEVEILTILSKANILNRFISKFLDFLIISAINQIPLESSFLAALFYLLIADGFSSGRSLGKQIIGLQTMIPETGGEASFKESIIRNLPFGLAYCVVYIPYLGWLLGISIVGFESLLLIGNPRGRRIGDELAKTQVLDLPTFEALKKGRSTNGTD